MAKFYDLGVSQPYIKALKELDIKTPTSIQEQAIPVLLNGVTDLVGLAQTGTGKTAAFGLPALHHINPKKKEVQTLILAPTRELVQQIKKQLFKFTKYTNEKIFIEAVFGGEKIDIQLGNLSRPTHIIVATPGRLIDLVKRNAVNLENIKTVILDEADEMLSMGFKNDLTFILSETKAKKQTWLFTATFPNTLDGIVKQYIKPNAVRLQVNREGLVNANISHFFVETSLNDKNHSLMQILESKEDERGIIFCKTKAGTTALKKQLATEGFNVDVLNGDMTQKERDRVMRMFKNTSLQILISTDVSARGIDVNNLAFVIHYQLPEHLEYYTHRSGRTARGGKTGESIALVLPTERNKVTEIEKDLGIKLKQRTL